MVPALWHGSSQEARDAMNAFAHHCTCYFEAGQCKTPCAAHVAFFGDQRMLNGLVWMRRQVDRLRREEWRER